jgi:hypothetical protein
MSGLVAANSRADDVPSLRRWLGEVWLHADGVKMLRSRLHSAFAERD